MTARLTTDWKLFVPILLLLAFGLVMVYSASSVVAEVVYERPIWEFAYKQLRFAGLGLVILFVLKSIDYRRFNQPHWVLVPLGLVVLMLIGVIFADPVAHRWYKLPRFNLQPSEFAKPAIVLFVAWFVAQREARKKGVNDRHTLGPAALVVGLTAVLIAVGDLGTAVILLVPAVVIFYVAGIERRYFFMTAALCLVLFAGFLIQKPYRIFRVMAPLGITVEMVAENPRLQWLAPIIAESKAARDPDYQPRQSRIAVASGGLAGRGLGQSNQKLGFLPEAFTDFIFGVAAEETGFAGCLLLLGGYLAIFWRGLGLFWRTSDSFGRYLVLGIVSLITTQALVNISVVIGLGPTKGLPLPLISYGGSSLLATLTLFGLLLSVSDRAVEP